MGEKQRSGTPLVGARGLESSHNSVLTYPTSVFPSGPTLSPELCTESPWPFCFQTSLWVFSLVHVRPPKEVPLPSQLPLKWCRCVQVSGWGTEG